MFFPFDKINAYYVICGGRTVVDRKIPYFTYILPEQDIGFYILPVMIKV